MHNINYKSTKYSDLEESFLDQIYIKNVNHNLNENGTINQKEQFQAIYESFQQLTSDDPSILSAALGKLQGLIGFIKQIPIEVIPFEILQRLIYLSDINSNLSPEIQYEHINIMSQALNVLCLLLQQTSDGFPQYLFNSGAILMLLNNFSESKSLIGLGNFCLSSADSRNLLISQDLFPRFYKLFDHNHTLIPPEVISMFLYSLIFYPLDETSPGFLDFHQGIIHSFETSLPYLLTSSKGNSASYFLQAINTLYASSQYSDFAFSLLNKIIIFIDGLLQPNFDTSIASANFFAIVASKSQTDASALLNEENNALIPIFDLIFDSPYSSASEIASGVLPYLSLASPRNCIEHHMTDKFLEKNDEILIYSSLTSTAKCSISKSALILYREMTMADEEIFNLGKIAFAAPLENDDKFLAEEIEGMNAAITLWSEAGESGKQAYIEFVDNNVELFRDLDDLFNEIQPDNEELHGKLNLLIRNIQSCNEMIHNQ